MTLFITANLFTMSVEDAQSLKSPWFRIRYDSNSVERHIIMQQTPSL